MCREEIERILEKRKILKFCRFYQYYLSERLMSNDLRELVPSQHKK